VPVKSRYTKMNPCPLQQMGQLGLQLLCPRLNTSCLCCVVDSLHNYFQNSLIGGFQAPINNGPCVVLCLIRFQFSLTNPHILDFLQAYIQFSGFNMSPRSEISQLHTTVCLRFVSTMLPALNPKLITHATCEGVVV
jgi:hypothetical protein